MIFLLYLFIFFFSKNNQSLLLKSVRYQSKGWRKHGSQGASSSFDVTLQYKKIVILPRIYLTTYVHKVYMHILKNVNLVHHSFEMPTPPLNDQIFRAWDNNIIRNGKQQKVGVACCLDFPALPSFT